MNKKVYVTLGFHINFYHSWRGDTPDEAGFGTDMRVIREILKMLDRANAAGLKARAYWDTEVYWTFQEIIPRHAPDILEGIRARVQAGWDEIVPGPFNNGANHAATLDEFRAALGWALENPWGSGLRQLFGRVAPFHRAQETMFTTGQEAVLKEFGLDGIILYYAGVAFNSISTFIPPLSLEQRYNPLWFRSREDQPPLVLLPAIAASDLVEQVSLENLMLDLHARQLRGEIQSDVLIHLNEDADLETWLPTKLPKALSWFPNLGGLEELIRAVNKYPWAEFSVPSEYAASHPPRAEVLVRQDLADGGFDGNYSWAEKCASLRLWTLLEQSRIASYRAEALAGRAPLQGAGLNLGPLLWEGMDSSFFQRLVGLTTTHFGMSTPIINEERQDRAFAILGKARDLAVLAEREAAQACVTASGADPVGGDRCVAPSSGILYDFELYSTPESVLAALPEAAVETAPKSTKSAFADSAASSRSPGKTALCLPVILPAGVNDVSGEDGAGHSLNVSLTDLEPLPGGRTAARVRLAAEIGVEEGYRVRLKSAAGGQPAAPALDRLENRWLRAAFSTKDGIASLTWKGEAGSAQIGGPGFLDPFVTYGGRTFHAAGYEFLPLPGETWDGLQRLRLKAVIPMQTPEGEFSSQFTYTFTLFDDLPCLYIDVEARYAYTPPRQVIHNLMQKLRRRIDLHWVETAPFQLTPALTAAASSRPFRVWKHNFMGITAFYDLDYGRVNPKNRDLDSFNHQVTAGWVAVSDGQHGLLLGEDASRLASMAFCPMRLRERAGLQTLSLNPFGSYYGKQLDYSHLGGNGNGAVVMQALSGALQPNGPSFNGETLRFSLLLAPYTGDEPPAALQAAAAAHFYPPGAIVHAAPAGVQAVTAGEIEDQIRAEQAHAALESGLPLDPPTAFLVNPSHNAADVVWDAPRAGPVTGYEVAWRAAEQPEWQAAKIGPLTRWRLDGLADGQELRFKMRALRQDSCSAWTEELPCTPGAVTDSAAGGMLSTVPRGTLLRVVVASLRAAIRAKWGR
jgi:hypothetical protein